MPDINEFTFWRADCVQDPYNSIYPIKVVVKDADSFNEMARFDHVAATYKDGHRGNETFIESTVQSGDVDNEKISDSDTWITRDDLHRIFEGVPHIISESKNHMKPKGDKPSAPRYHIFWAADKETDCRAYWAGKLCGAIVRISGILCRAEKNGCYIFLQEEEPLIVDAETMQRAIALGRYYTEHARAAYLLMGADPVVKQCKYVLKAICTAGLIEVSKRDVMRLCRSFKKAEELTPVLERLCDYGYIAPKTSEAKNAIGRPASQGYRVNPALFSDGQTGT